MEYIKKGKESRDLMRKGINTLADQVGATLGPKGMTIILDQYNNWPVATKDGVSVAQQCHSEDQFENAGMKLFLQVALKSSMAAGDGTTTATVIAQSIINQALDAIDSGANAVDIRDSIDDAIAYVLKAIDVESKKCTTKKDIENIACISANNDKHIGKLISDAIKKTGIDGIITSKIGNSTNDELIFTEGLTLTATFASPYFINNKESNSIEYDNPYILIYDDVLNNVNDILTILTNVRKEARPIIIICDHMDTDTATIMVKNFTDGIINCAVLRTPIHGDLKKEMLKDFAAVTGATMITHATGLSLSEATMEHLGSCKSIKVTDRETIVVDGAGSKESVEDRISIIKGTISTTTNENELDQLRNRLSKLSGGAAVISVGGVTQLEVGEKKGRVEDAIHSARAAISSGYVDGGGITLYRIGNSMPDKGLGYDIVANAMIAPIKKILKNCGRSEEDTDIILEEINKGKGYNALTSKHCNMYEAGIIDPAKVVKIAVQAASSISSIVISTEGVITHKPITED